MAGIRSAFRRDLLEGQVAVVSGGGSGIGLRIGLELAHVGCRVVLCGRSEERLASALQEVERRLDGAAGEVLACSADIRSRESVDRLMQYVADNCGRLDILVNNAGGQFPSAAEHLSDNGFGSVVDLNLGGTFRMAQAAFKRFFRPQASGVVVNVIAQMWQGFPLMAHTGAARAAVHNLTMSLAVEWAARGVRVTSVAPGTIRSSGLDTYGPGFQKVLEEASRLNYLHRLGTVEEVAAAVVFLASPAAAYVTGTTLRVDGGESLYCARLPPDEANRKHFGVWQDVQGNAKL